MNGLSSILMPGSYDLFTKGVEWCCSNFKEGFEWSYSCYDGCIEWLFSIFAMGSYYNMSLVLTMLSCKDSPSDKESHIDAEPAENSNFLSLWLSALIDTVLVPVPETATENRAELNTCYSILDINTIQVVPYRYIIFLFIFFCIILALLIGMCVKSSNKLDTVPFVEEREENCDERKEINNTGKSSEGIVRKSIPNCDVPLLLSFSNPGTRKERCDLKRLPAVDELLEMTIGMFLSSLDGCLGINDGINVRDTFHDFNSSAPTSLATTVSSLTSPRLSRRGILRNKSGNMSFTSEDSGQSMRNKNILKQWIVFEEFVRRMNWTFPDDGLENINIGELAKGDSMLSNVLQFLYRNSIINGKQWSAASLIVNYCLFILEQELLAMSQTSPDVLKFLKLESMGSAADGTQMSLASYFDTMLVLGVNGCSALTTVFHNNFSEEIPPGHVIMAVQESQGSNLFQTSKCLRKAFVHGAYGYFLQTLQVEHAVDAWLKKAVNKINCTHKSKTDRLPFQLHTSADKTLILNIDTRLLQGLGLGVGEIKVRFVPSFPLTPFQFCLLPPLYAVPSWRADHRKVKNNPPLRGSLGGYRIFRNQDQNSNADLFWNISIYKLETALIDSIEGKILASGVVSHHKVCIKILKALLSEGNKNMLLNKGEINACIISTVVHFLMQESPPSAWALEHLADRVSDAIHFLRSAFENVWLPNFVVNNPHLMAQIPALEVLAPLISGRQQNLLADVSADAASKVLSYMEGQLQKTDLIKCIKSDYSPQMWEYEFFMFG